MSHVSCPESLSQPCLLLCWSRCSDTASVSLHKLHFTQETPHWGLYFPAFIYSRFWQTCDSIYEKSALFTSQIQKTPTFFTSPWLNCIVTLIRMKDSFISSHQQPITEGHVLTSPPVRNSCTRTVGRNIGPRSCVMRLCGQFDLQRWCVYVWSTLCNPARLPSANK